MENNELFTAWVNMNKYHDRILRAVDQKLKKDYMLGINEFYVLYHLIQSEEKKMSLSELVPRVGLSHSALSRLVTRLGDYRGEAVVERRKDDKDKRSVGIFLTGAGEKLFNELQTVINDGLESQMSEKDIENIKRLVE